MYGSSYMFRHYIAILWMGVLCLVTWCVRASRHKTQHAHLLFRPSTPEALHVMRHERHLLVKDRITGEEWPVNLACNSDFHVNHRVLLHAANLRHGTDGFTSSPKEGMLWIIFAPKNPTVSAGFEPAILGTRGQHANQPYTTTSGIMVLYILIHLFICSRYESKILQTEFMLLLFLHAMCNY
jgi:hypothetical protein